MERQIPRHIGVLIVEDLVVFPGMIVPLVVKDERSVKLIDWTLTTRDKMVGSFTLKSSELDERNERNFFHVGVASTILRMLRFPDRSIRIIIQGVQRIRLRRVIEREPFMKAEIEVLKEKKYEKDIETEALMRSVEAAFQRIGKIAPYITDELQIQSMNITLPVKLADFVASHLNLTIKEKQELLETLDVKKRLYKLIPLMAKEESILGLGEKIRSSVKTEFGKSQREHFLREQLKAIKKELGEKDEKEAEIEEIRKKIKEAKMSKEAEKVAKKELERLEHIPPAAAEYTVCRTYLDWLTSLPWQKETKDNLDIKRAEQILDEDHYDLEDVKERILEYLAVRKLRKDAKGPILCFVGPPGVGKTSLGMSIARALGRKFVKFSLGGIRDEAEIRGHRRTYVGALPGRIIQGIRKAGSNNPVFMLDEIDKIGADFRGDPAAALLEALDPEENKHFSDHYLDVEFDLSKVMFITTANIVDPILPALKDRMELIHLPGYIVEEKLRIAKDFLIPKQIKENGLSPEYIKFRDKAIISIIQNYTREAGVRNLEREIASCIRKVAKKVAKTNVKTKSIISCKNLSKLIGPPKFFSELAERKGEVGVVTGLAYTPQGGSIMFIEAIKMKGKKGLNLTGRLGEVMKESAQAALSYVRSSAKKFNLPENFFENCDIHIHVPEGAVPKDGPSAGVSIVTALVSLLKNTPVDPHIGMTGEVTLRGKVLPVGGIKEKVIAAKRAGIKTIILPEWNNKDLEKVPSHVKKGIKFEFVNRVDEVISIALGNNLKMEKK
jgi:ATP-dependent Lon protease